ELPRLGPRAGARDVVEEPRELRPREVRIEQKAGFRAKQRFMALLSQRVTKGRGASVLPHDGIRDGTASGALPEERGLALVGDADRGDLACAEAGERQRLGRHVALRAPDLGR